jgi:putative MATE family efflux protein
MLRLAFPAMGERLLTMAVTLVDTALVGHLGASALAAVSLANEWVFLGTVLFWVVGSGATTLIAHSVGAGDWRTANRAVQQALLVGLTNGLIALALALWLAEPAVRFMGAEPEALAKGVTFLRIAAAVFPLSAMMFVGNACLRGAGDTRTPLIVMAIVNALNIGVSWATIHGTFGLPALGVTGSALGTAAGRGIGGLLVILILIKGRSGLKLDLGALRIDREVLRRLLRVGVPTGVERLAWRFGMMTFMRSVASLGTVAVAAHTVANRAESLSYMPGFGFAVASTTLVGQSLGAGRPREAERSGYMTFRFAATLMGTAGLCFVLFPQVFTGLFTNDPAVIRTAAGPLRLIGFVQPILAAAFVFPGSLRGAGDTRFPMIVTSASIWVIRVPLALLLGSALGMGLTGAWIGMTLDLVVRGIIYFFRFRRGRWKSAKV